MDSESTTRKERIDPRLAAARWSVRRFEQAYLEQLPNESAVEESPKQDGGPASWASVPGSRPPGRRPLQGIQAARGAGAGSNTRVARRLARVVTADTQQPFPPPATQPLSPA
jgi:hypothetical protein